MTAMYWDLAISIVRLGRNELISCLSCACLQQTPALSFVLLYYMCVRVCAHLVLAIKLPISICWYSTASREALNGK